MDVSLYSLLPTGSHSPFLSTHPSPMSPFPSLLSSACSTLFVPSPLLVFPPSSASYSSHSLCYSKVMRGKRRKKGVEKRGKGGGFKVKWWRRLFFPLSFFFKILPVWEEQTRAPRPLGSSLVCTGCRSGDMATGFHPNCRNISSTVESGIAGKDNENRTAWRKGEDEGGGMGHGLVYTAVIQIQLL